MNKGTRLKSKFPMQFTRARKTFSARVSLSNDYLQAIGENLKIENLSQEEIDMYARRYLREWLETEKITLSDTTQ